MNEFTDLRLPDELEQTALHVLGFRRNTALVFLHIIWLVCLGMTPFALHDLYLMTGGRLGIKLMNVTFSTAAGYSRYRTRSGGIFLGWVLLLAAAVGMVFALRGIAYGKRSDYRCVREMRYRHGRITVTELLSKNRVRDEDGFVYTCLIPSDYDKLKFGSVIRGIALDNDHRYAVTEGDHRDVFVRNEDD